MELELSNKELNELHNIMCDETDSHTTKGERIESDDHATFWSLYDKIAVHVKESNTEYDPYFRLIPMFDLRYNKTPEGLKGSDLLLINITYLNRIEYPTINTDVIKDTLSNLGLEVEMDIPNLLESIKFINDFPALFMYWSFDDGLEDYLTTLLKDETPIFKEIREKGHLYFRIRIHKKNDMIFLNLADQYHESTYIYAKHFHPLYDMIINHDIVWDREKQKEVLLKDIEY